MAKLLFVKIWLSKKRDEDGRTEITYPPIFDDETLKGVPYLYQDTGEIGDNVREYLAGFIVPGTPKERVQKILEDPDIEPMTEQEVNELGKEIYPERDEVTDASACILVLSIKEEDRTLEQEAVLDPNDSTPGIVHIPEYNVRDRIPEYFEMAERLEKGLPLQDATEEDEEPEPDYNGLGWEL